jgi:uncharacterized protein
MHIIGLLLGSLLFTFPALAFDCAGITLPSSIVICGDPELIRLADERQQAINETRARIGEDKWTVLWEDQKTWVRTYAAACGVPPDSLPPIPVPNSVKECFRRAAIARIAFVRNYLIGDPPAKSARPGKTGPGFDCANVRRPLPLMICTDAELARVDLLFNQAYWALYQQLSEYERQRLKSENLDFLEQIQERCGVPKIGELNADVWRGRDCVKSGYETKRLVWISRLSGPARDEATRDLARHIALESKLRTLGLLTTAPIPEGVYGPATRTAITRWQVTRDRSATGLLSDADARALEAEAGEPQNLASISIPSSTQSGDKLKNLPDTANSALRTEVALELEMGTYRVPVRINDQLTLKFTMDSGAADVVIPADVVLTLIRTETVSRDDFVGEGRYVLADGSTTKSARFILRKLKVGDLVLDNVRASVGDPKGTPLLGQTFLSRFETVTQDNKRKVLVLVK